MRNKENYLNKRQKWLRIWGLVTFCITGISILLIYRFHRTPDAVLITDGGAVEGITNVHSQTGGVLNRAFSFKESALSSGIQFHHFPFDRSSLIVEDMGSGLAWGDYDNDGDPDLFLVNFSSPLLDTHAQSNTKYTHALYQNQGNGVFIDVSLSANIDIPSFGMGAAWGDYDNDSDLDLYVTNYGPNFLFQNNGDGTFHEVSKQSGVDDSRFSTGIAWGDYNRDGWIDLYVCNYVDFVYHETDRARIVNDKRIEYPYTLNPSSYPPQPNSLYRNNGNGTFTDVAKELNIHNPDGRSLSASWTDFDLDGDADLYVANDVSNNALYKNLGNGRFEDCSSSSLSADYRGAMGIAVGDYNRDRAPDMFITHWLAQENALYQNMYTLMSNQPDVPEPLFFTDNADENGLGQISLDMVGWSTSFTDFDDDGWLDLWVANGNTLENSKQPKQLIPQRLFLFWHEPGNGFIEMGQTACQFLSQPIVARGGASADYNLDGRMDFAVQQHGANTLLFQNQTANDYHWIQFQLKQTNKNTQALGARLEIITEDGIQSLQVGSQGLYLSQDQNIMHFGLGKFDTVKEVHIFWPDGTTHKQSHITANQTIVLTHQPNYE